MRHFTVWSILCGFVLVLAPGAVCAQSTGKTPDTERGWGSAWQQPATEQQRKEGELLQKLAAAQKAGNSSAALTVCDQLVTLVPGAPGPYMNRAGVRDQLKQYDRALADLDRAQEQAQKQFNHRAAANIDTLRAQVHAQQKNYPASVSDLQAAIKLNDKSETAYNELAWLRATAPDAAFRNGPEGVRLARRAVALSEKNIYSSTDTLAAAYAEANDYPRAVESEKRALSLAEKEIKDAAKAKKFREDASKRLQLFEQRQPYHAELM